MNKSNDLKHVPFYAIACFLEEVGRNCPIVLLDGKTMSPLHQQLKHTMRPYVRHRLQGTWGDREKTTLRLTSPQAFTK